jgi:DNA-binding NtrC family response regulator
MFACDSGLSLEPAIAGRGSSRIVPLKSGQPMKLAEMILLCSASPGFLRHLGGVLTGRARLLECYSLPEVSQMVPLHRPDRAVFDVRAASPQQLARTLAVIGGTRPAESILVGTPGQLRDENIPLDLPPTRALTLAATDSGWTELADQILDSSTGVPEPQSDRSATSGASREDSANVATEAVDPQSMVDRFRTRTPELRAMLRRLDVAARHNVTILLIGETGSGKTHLAGLIHESSPRSSHPFLHVACGALPGDLIESELFGHVKGAFTSAHADKDGKFLAAGEGTILLDEIDVLTPDQQVKLLRVIEQGEFEPVGSNRTLQVRARIIAASNLELRPLVEQGRFRPDLYYRLNTLCFTIPPLRKRLPDVEPLARYFVHRHAAQLGIEITMIDQEFVDCLLSYPWPGNVREMENAIRSAVIYCSQGRMTVETLPVHIVAGHAGPANDPSVTTFFAARRGESLGNRIELTERDIIEQALLSNNFSRTNTARHLGISRVTLYNKMRKHGILPER